MGSMRHHGDRYEQSRMREDLISIGDDGAGTVDVDARRATAVGGCGWLR